MYPEFKRWLKRLLDFLRRCCSGDGKKVEPDAMDLTVPSTPIAFPLSSLDELADDTLYTSFHFPFLRSTVPLQISKGSSAKKGPKLLVCHDMKGGYQDDKFVQGDANGKAFSIWHWQCIDVFVYFSHTLVTIPPPCWTNAAHLHGVKCLGTFITEWDAGVENCKKLLASEETAKMYAFRLAQIAYELGFDGWLLNLENTIEPDRIETLIYFIQTLTSRMHELVPGSVVIWYDAVTIDGKLEWQDSLTPKNKPFFDVSDGIFVNYTWKKDYPKQAGKAAGSRAFDVYMGVDVFGRNTYGGGGYKSDVALQAALDGGVSAALFAPGWVYETDQGPTFEDAQNRFWAAIHATWSIAHNVPVNFPLFTDFSQGFGQAMYMDGKEVSSMPWSNISCQGLQPLMKLGSDLNVQVRSGGNVYSGGSTLHLYGNLSEGEVSIAELFHANVPFSSAPLATSFSTFRQPGCNFSLALRLEDNVKGTSSLIFLEPESRENAPFTTIHNTTLTYGLKPVRFCGSGKSTNSWEPSEFIFEVEEGSTLTLIYGLSYVGNRLDYKKASNLIVYPENHRSNKKPSNETKIYDVHLGYLRITNKAMDVPYKLVCFGAEDIKWSVNSSSQERFISLKLIWELEGGSFSQYNVYASQTHGDDGGEVKYLGVAFVQAYFVDSLNIQAGKTQITFHLQPRTSAGEFKQNFSVQIPDKSSSVWTDPSS